MPALVATDFASNPNYFGKSDKRIKRFVRFRSNFSLNTPEDTMSTPSNISVDFSPRESLRWLSTPALQSRTVSASSNSTANATSRSDPVSFAGWRDQYDEDEDIAPQETQRFPTSYLRHRCSTPVEEHRNQQNYVWYTQEEEDAEKSEMMDQDVQVKIEEVDGTLDVDEEATFWQVSGPGFVWGQCYSEEQQICDHPMDEE